MKINLLLSALVVLSFELVHAQEKIITGIVRDHSGEAIPGSTILVKGTNNAVAADANGEFNIKTSKEFPFTLVVNAVGFQPQDVEIYELPEEAINVQLKTNNVLDEVVVVGYGEQKRKDITGSIGSIPNELKTQPVASVERLLQGAIAGAIVTQTSGQPGGGMSVQIRGSNSINASSEPLYVIDGFPINNDYSINSAGVITAAGSQINPLSTINTADIESVDVLKDASATAIYGSRGANGVIVITTKKGKHNETSIHYDGYYGVQSVRKTIPLMTAGEWWQLGKDAAYNTSPAAVNTLKSNNAAFLNAAQAGGYTLDTLGVGTDWQKAAFTQAAIQSHSLSFNSGTNKTKLSFAGNYFSQDGIIRETGFKRYSFRFNIDHEFNSKLRLQSYSTISRIDSKVAPSGFVSSLLFLPSAFPIYNDNGTFLQNPGVSGTSLTLRNPINSLYNQINNTSANRFLSNFSLEYKIIDGLTAKVLFGVDFFDNKENQYLPQNTFEGAALKGYAAVGTINTLNWLNENTVSYTKTFNSIHSINATAGFMVQRSTSEGVVASSQNYATDIFTYNNLGAAVTPNSPSSSYSQWSLASWLARVNYSFQDKYLVTLSLRSDGSSRFGSNNKWGNFPSAAVGWNLHQEEFLKNFRQISNLKLRASAGLTGNQSIPPYSSLGQLGYFRYNFNGQTVSGYAPTTVANNNLGWEKTFQVDVGVDLGLLNNKVNIIADYYYKKTSDLLLSAIVSGTSGLAIGGNVNTNVDQTASVLQNLGVVSNQGVELAINTHNISTPSFRWNTMLVFSKNTNKVLDLGAGISRIVPNPNAPSVIEVGQPLGSFLVYKTDGLIQPGEDGPSALTPQQNKGVGGQKYVDVDHNGVINQADRVVIANNPGLNVGFTNTFNYKNFDLTVFFQTSIGGKLYNQNRAQLELNNGGLNGDAAAANAYRVPGTRGADDPGLTNTNVKAAYQDPAITVSSDFIEDASYVRLKNISLGYSIPASVLAKAHISQLRIYVSGQNLWTYTNYTGFDPEVSAAGQSLLNRGVDYGIYPNYKSIQAGVQLTF